MGTSDFRGNLGLGNIVIWPTWLFSPGWNSFLPSRNPTWTQRKFTNDRGRWRVLLYLLPAIRLDWRSFAGASSTPHQIFRERPHLRSKRNMTDLHGFPYLGELETWRKKKIISCKVPNTSKHLAVELGRKNPISNSNDHFGENTAYLLVFGETSKSRLDISTSRKVTR